MATKKIIITQLQYEKLLQVLIKKIKQSNFPVRQIVCIARGGLIPGAILSYTLKVPLAVISVSSYPGDKIKQEQVLFSRDLTTAKPLLNKGVLVVDDLTESGLTLKETVHWLKWWYRIPAKEIRTVTVWHKATCPTVPDFYAQLIKIDPRTKTCPWIVQPHENF